VVVDSTFQGGSGWTSGGRCVSFLVNATLVLVVLGHSAPAVGGAYAVAPPAASTAAPAGPADAPVYPLRVETGKRYLVDAAGRPFLIHGDAAWSLITEPSREEVDRYLDDRRARGFNTIIINLVEHRFATNAPANAYGERPFHGQAFEWASALTDWVPRYGTTVSSLFADYASPNDAYFTYADWVLRRAAEKGFLVLLAPSFTGWHGGSEGWYTAMVANGPDRLRKYGEYLGRRYRDFPNILWVQGGDYDPPDKDLVRAIAEGIREYDPRALQTVHGAPETPVTDYWRGEPWLQVDNVYTYEPVYAAALAHYARPERLPFFLIESAYENEHGITEQDLRTQAYQAVLCGAAGQVFGNNPVWHFQGPGLYPAPVTWQQALDSPGARSMTHLHELMASLPWWLLEPDTQHSLLISGHGPSEARAVAARASDRSLALIYLPTARDITVDLGQLAGPQVAARWYDPADGQFITLSGSPFPAAGIRRLKPERAGNSSGFDDWALILQSAP
jgi:hypothetical protein